jgi:predicted GIY-YIG superfamily endonuclease
LPVRIAWCEESNSKSEALKREAFIKKLSKKAKELIVKESQAKTKQVIECEENI